MALMRLLTVGRSLDEARDRPHRYKLMTGAMPTFGHVNGMKVGRRSVMSIGKQQESAVETDTAAGEPMMKAETAEGSGKAPTTYPLGRWALKANPFKSPAPTAASAVQGELSLEKVKVVRNDLSDSDLELVTASQPTQVKDGENTRAGAAMKKPSVLARIKRRLFRARAH